LHVMLITQPPELGPYGIHTKHAIDQNRVWTEVYLTD
jgi:hypothetical protein